ncbi:hypothetical protein ACFORG_14215 [Lutimaribacter marinistellae]|uniref:Lipid A 3-O-deacylase (PagL) n=1 Tax=Lutimaribacter marinistellae TaxID=1820329 RepID=A0ABV7TIP2_9RHOB
MRVLAAAAVAAFFAAGQHDAQAGPDRVSILLGSHHVGATRNFEEFNPGIILVWDERVWRGNLDIAAGAYRNSYGDGSLALSLAYPFVKTDDWGLDLFGGFSWYPGNGQQFSHAIGDVVPIAGLQARYRNVFMQAIPAGGQAADAVFSFGLTFAME